MAKRKREDEISSADAKSPISETYERMAKHRSCWIHMLAHMYARGKKITKQEAEELRSFKLTSQCFLGTFPCGARSKRKIKCKKAIGKEIREKIKLDSRAFDCYFEHMWRNFSEDKRTFITYFDCLWFNLYTKASFKGKVLTWIKKKQIFSKKYVLVPIVHWSHWSLLIFCHLGESLQSKLRTPCMLLLDSLEKAGPRCLEPDIRKFVLDIYKSEGRAENKELISKIPLLVPKVPQQRGGEECGNYVLYYINLFVQGAPENFCMDGYPYFMKQNWFSPGCLEAFFEKLEPIEM
ncbi:PREDICTED: probable ubiquitin-like-specific protease 2A [Populus euphratica]|uniref:Probable ubiquitin-like-specific protease 2A n=1 Tax=Populus euphratica TaxID=75702 RepID=A0AAJ6U680_POPEU|nr:PREDICTED: probable ubiquitin-like-specific protease 2A [Populus euphratica]XP_011024083.1 PREDICTED: probable ubiquitin-like-specific protease 2A [Populus euphratica]